MKHPSIPYLFACLIVGAAVILAAHNGSLSWMLVGAFAVVVFPRWRGKAYRLAEIIVSKAKRDSGDPE